MITTVRDFIASVKMMRTAQKLREKTGSLRSKRYAAELEKEVDAALETAMLNAENRVEKRLLGLDDIDEICARG